MWLLLALWGCGGDGDEPADKESAPTDAGPTDADADGYAEKDDCDDANAAVNPGDPAHDCDGVDADCDGTLDEDGGASWYPDTDGDGFGAAAGAVVACDAPAGTVANDIDCDDTSAEAQPDGRELCDGLDNDCNGVVDDDASDAGTWPLDSDGDGAGSESASVTGCTMPANAVENTWDCDDTDATEPLFVDAAAGSRGDGTMARPYDTLAQAIEGGARCVAVKAGTYEETLSLVGSTLRIVGVDGSAVTTLKTPTVDTRQSVVSVLRGGALTLEGFTVTGGTGTEVVDVETGGSGTNTYYYYYYTYRGGAVYVVDGAFTGRDLVLTGNDTGGHSDTSGDNEYYSYEGAGGAIHATRAAMSLEDVTVEGNHAYQVSAIWQEDGTLEATRLAVIDNAGDFLTLYFQGAQVDLDAFLMSENTSDSGESGFQVSGSDLTLWNGTIAGNDIGLYCSDDGTVSIHNSIVYDNEYGLADTSQGNDAWDMTFNDVYGNGQDYYGLASPAGVGGNLSVDPAFVSWRRDGNPGNDDLRLAAGSPAIDAGDAGVLDGDGSRSDMGGFGGPEGIW